MDELLHEFTKRIAMKYGPNSMVEAIILSPKLYKQLQYEIRRPDDFDPPSDAGCTKIIYQSAYGPVEIIKGSTKVSEESTDK